MIVFGAYGLLLALSVFVVPGYVTVTTGRWIHCMLWLDVDQVREWASSYVADLGTSIEGSELLVPHDQWPAPLKRAVVGPGRLCVNPKSASVTVVQGSGFGHWGIEIVPAGGKGMQESVFRMRIRSGAWVWYELQ